VKLAPIPGNTKAKACATCKTVKLLTAFARHAHRRADT
jgi:hypothetical protein